MDPERKVVEMPEGKIVLTNRLIDVIQELLNALRELEMRNDKAAWDYIDRAGGILQKTRDDGTGKDGSHHFVHRPVP